MTSDEYRVTNAVAIQKTFVIHLYISYNTHVDGCSADGVSEPLLTRLTRGAARLF